MAYAHPEYLVETHWLEDHLGSSELRVFDCTVRVEPNLDGTFSMCSGKDTWEQGHIPGAGFLDLIAQISDPDAKLMFMMPTAAHFETVMSKAGIGQGTRVILYSTVMTAWATRVWWTLRAFGFDNVAVLNGGWKKWELEGRPVSSAATVYPEASFKANPRPDMIADKAEVLGAVGADDVCLMNALPSAMYHGKVLPYVRAGHIASSVNVPAMVLEDPKSGTFLPAEALKAELERAGALSDSRVITYCGGGIAASHNAFALSLLGKDNVAVYDASLSEWAYDPDAPMEVG